MTKQTDTNKRINIHVVYVAPEYKDIPKPWKVEEGGARIREFVKKREAEKYAAERGREIHNLGGKAEVKLHRMDGVITESNTYGEDPREILG